MGQVTHHEHPVVLGTDEVGVGFCLRAERHLPAQIHHPRPALQVYPHHIATMRCRVTVPLEGQQRVEENLAIDVERRHPLLTKMDSNPVLVPRLGADDAPHLASEGEHEGRRRRRVVNGGAIDR